MKYGFGYYIKLWSEGEGEGEGEGKNELSVCNFVTREVLLINFVIKYVLSGGMC